MSWHGVYSKLEKARLSRQDHRLPAEAQLAASSGTSLSLIESARAILSKNLEN
jgi:hypothetical protein